MIRCNRCGKDKAFQRLFFMALESPNDEQYDYCAECYDSLVKVIEVFNECRPLYTGYLDDPDIIISGTI
jgi:NAD-dependent SIR2 family protein deacetylase